MRKTIQVKNEKGKYEETYTTYDALDIYESLAEDLIAKKLKNASYITRIKRTNLYNVQKIEVYYNNATRAIYVIKN